MKKIIAVMLSTMLLAISGQAMAKKDLKITKKERAVTIQTEAGEKQLKRLRTSSALITGFLVPHEAAEGVEVIGELELLDIMKNPEGWVLMDHRGKKYFDEGSLPTAINIPYNVAEGAAPEFKGKKIVSFCYGANCPLAMRGIKALIKGGHPASDIKYYRGGIVQWTVLGFPLAIDE